MSFTEITRADSLRSPGSCCHLRQAPGAETLFATGAFAPVKNCADSDSTDLGHPGLNGRPAQVTGQVRRPGPCHQARLSVPLPRLGLMADNRLSVRDREFFLAEPHVAALSVSAGQGRGPRPCPSGTSTYRAGRRGC